MSRTQPEEYAQALADLFDGRDRHEIVQSVMRETGLPLKRCEEIARIVLTARAELEGDE